MNLRAIVFSIFILFSVQLIAQPKLILYKNDYKREVTIKPGNEVIIENIDASGKTDWWGRKAGRVIAITDSTLVIKALFAKAKTIRLEEIGKIKKVYFLRTLYGIAVSASAAYFLATESPHLIVIFSLPAAVLSVIYDSAINPMKRIDERIWQGNNKWKMFVTATEL